MRALLLPVVLLTACAHQDPLRERLVPIAVPCITTPVQPPANRVTDEQLDKAKLKQFAPLAAARILQDSGYIRELRAQVETCAKLPVAP
jgi:hypothetical protein